MGLQLKFNLVIVIASIVIVITGSLFARQYFESNAREEVIRQTRIMLESALAVRSYTVKEIRPLLAVQQKRQFLPQTVPAYAASRYMAELRIKHPEYNYREAVLNPTNPSDRALDWEADIINAFRNDVSQTEIIGERKTPTGRLLFLGKPITIKNEGCLTCHSTPARAPNTLVAMYGSANGFGWKMNETVGAQIVSVPMSVPMAEAEQTIQTFVSALSGVVLTLILLLNLMLNFIVIRPVKTLSKQADEVSMGALNVEELPVKSKDEISSLTRSINRMHRSLSNALKMLEEND